MDIDKIFSLKMADAESQTDLDIYPRIQKHLEPIYTFTGSEQNHSHQNYLFQQRCNEILSQKHKVEEEINKLNKLKSKWNLANNIIKYSGYTIFLSTGAAATVCASLVTAGIAVPSSVILTTSSIGLIHTSITKVFSKTITSKKTKKYRKKINVLNSYLDKMFVFFEKARSDQLISNDEIEEFKKLKDLYITEKSTTMKEWEKNVEKRIETLTLERNQNLKNVINVNRDSGFPTAPPSN